METTTSLMETKVEDMTVGDAMKLNAYVLAAMAGIGVAFVGIGVAKDKYSTWKYNRAVKALNTEA